MNRLVLFLSIIVVSFFVQVAQAQSVSLVNAFPHLTFHLPLFLTHSPDSSNRIFVVRQDGFIEVFPNDSTVTSPRVFLDLSKKINSFTGEQGVLGLAFPPDFSTSRVFYVNYTTISSNSTSFMKVVVARYAVSSADSNVADTSSETRLLEIEEPYSNHNGGMLAFGPDSNLYIGVGDGGSANDPQNYAQSLNTLLGKILRIDVRGDTGYSIPRDNPFVSDSTGARKEIWAYGLRNPWRFSFDDSTGDLWVGDVGQGAREEIDIVTRGGNYGWRIMEGMICRPGGDNCDSTGLIPPLADYKHDVAASITGGYLYRGSNVPMLRGAYVFGDYVKGNLFLLRRENGIITMDSLFMHTAFNISSFGVDEKNELYVVNYKTGQILKFTGSAGSTSVNTSNLPLEYALEQNWPNPFNPTTSIKYTIGGVRGQGLGARDVSLIVYDLLGREVATLVNEPKTPGTYEMHFDGSGLASGVYLYRLTAGEFTQARAMVLLK